MKRYGILLFFMTGVMAMAFFGSHVVRAVDEPLTETQISRIKARCVEVRASLNQLHTTDALLRVNRGQIYESLSTKLMAPFNSRLILNRLDGVELVSITTEYNRQLESFRNNYQEYEKSLASTLAIDCRVEPERFHQALSDARMKRKATHDATVTLGESISKYREAVQKFKLSFGGDEK